MILKSSDIIWEELQKFSTYAEYQQLSYFFIPDKTDPHMSYKLPLAYKETTETQERIQLAMHKSVSKIFYKLRCPFPKCLFLVHC